MPTETEAKIKVVDFAPIRQRLTALKASPAGEHLETNTFFDTVNGALQMADKGLRLRANGDIRTGDTDYIVTFKGPRQPGELKTRQEIEFQVDDADAATAAFEALGFQTTLSFQKRRESWKLLGCKIELDELPYLGFFVEIEGASTDQIMLARDALGLAQEPLVTNSYVAMLAEHLRQYKINSRHIIFT